MPTDLSLTRARAALQYQPGADGYIQWVNDGISAWTLKGAGMGANAEAEVGDRPVPYEPMVRRVALEPRQSASGLDADERARARQYIILNLGLSENFGAIDYVGLEALWPVHMVRFHVPAAPRSTPDVDPLSSRAAVRRLRARLPAGQRQEHRYVDLSCWRVCVRALTGP